MAAEASVSEQLAQRRGTSGSSTCDLSIAGPTLESSRRIVNCISLLYYSVRLVEARVLMGPERCPISRHAEPVTARSEYRPIVRILARGDVVQLVLVVDEWL